MNILFVRTRPLVSNTSSSLRAISTVKMLVDAGAQVTVLCADLPTKEDDLRIEFENSIKTVKVKTTGVYSSATSENASSNKKSFKKKIRGLLRRVYSGFNVIDPLKCVTKQFVGVKNQLDEKYDVIVSCSDPKSSHLLANKVIKQGIKCDKYIQIWGDPLALDITRKFYYPRFVIKNIERNILKPATSIYYVSPFTCAAEKEQFKDLYSKMNVLLPTYQQTLIYKPVDKIGSIGYFGDYFSNSRNIIPLYETVKKMGLKAKICGNSDINIDKTENIEVYPRVSKETIDRFQEEVDLLVCIGNTHGTQIPGKIYQYAATNKPILLINDGSIDFEKLYGEYNRFIFADNSVKSISDALVKAAGEDYSKLCPLNEFSSEARLQDIKRMIEL